MADQTHHAPTTNSDDPLTVAEVEAVARTRLPSHVYNYYAGGSDGQHAVRRNRDAFASVNIVPRVLRDVKEVSTETEIFGRTSALPIAFAPSAMQRLAGGEGEIDTARAAVKAGLSLTLSSQSTVSLEDVMEAAKAAADGGVEPNFWFQIYLTADWEWNTQLIARAEEETADLVFAAAGYKALVLTVDTPVLGNRLGERKSPVVLPRHLKLANYPADNRGKPSLNRQLMDARTAAQARKITSDARGTLHDPSLDWHVVARLKSLTSMKVILKGVMAPEDARLAVEKGADAIVVSNHGGRQLDDIPSTLEVLPAVAEAVAGRIPVIFDGGVRQGSHVFKAIALGADLVLVGRPVLWGLGYKGQEGVEAVVHILERELSRTMALAGVTTVADIANATLVHRANARL
ncbi:unnamed protein product [Clonostachys byssicola]|uniref:FMN hydroxy acid dehydrogenase domain-containing protein n=1 Tax=Clonostachys byssicola TaxID=160290 RepID=A0A9N9XYG0_9HYPO|nr:unnamed protein product [Clonostachys byssicola]